jgi:NADH-quinone oxidoreductase subunit M
MDFLIMNEGFPILSIVIFLPLAGALIQLFIPGDNANRIWAMIVTSITAVVSLPLYSRFDLTTHKYQFGEFHPWIPSLKINYILGVDGISLLLILLTTLLMPLCVLCSWRYITKRVKPFMICLLIMETSMLGVFMALDFVLFYILWEAMLIPMYLLFLAFALAFAIKVPMFPFHTWLPAAHVEAPTAGSVVLASVLLKMGTYGFLRFCLPITPEATFTFMPYMLWLSIAGIIYGGFTALAQSDMKKLVAYSSVGHMGFVTLGIFILNNVGIEGAILQMINHGVTTGALFICVGMIYERTHSRELALATGVGKFMPFYITFLAFFSLSSLAFPGTNSFVGEFMVLAGTFENYKIIAACAIPGAVLAAAYMLRMLQKVAWGGINNPDHAANGLVDLNLREIITLAPLLIFVFWIGLGPQPFLEVMHTSVAHLLEQVNAANPDAAVKVAEMLVP